MFEFKSKILSSNKRRSVIAIFCSVVAVGGGIFSWTVLQPPHNQDSTVKNAQTTVQQAVESKPAAEVPVANILPAPQSPAITTNQTPVPAHSSTPSPTPLDFTLSTTSLTFTLGQISDPITATTTGGQNVDWSIISEDPSVYISYNDAGGQVWLKRPPASSTRSVVLHVANPDAVAPGTYKVRIEAHYNLKTVAKNINVTLLAR